MMGENKQEILNHLADALNLCRITGNLDIDMEFDEKTELVRVYERYSGRTITTVNVACDSGIAMIRDILRNDFFN